MKLIAKILRGVCYPLVTFKPTYYLGMVLVRMGRKLRTRYSGKFNGELCNIKVFGNVEMRVNPNFYMGGTLFWYGMHHISEIIYLKKEIESDYIFVDIGANQGEFSLFAASRISSGKVMAFEPTKLQKSYLKNNAELNDFKHLEIYEYGLSNMEKEVPIFTSTDTKLHDGFHEGLSSIFSSSKTNTEEDIIKLKVFDDQFYENLTRLDFIKIDIEGAELHALEGMKKSIEKFKPKVLIEINEPTFQSAGYSTSDVITFFGSFNYNFYQILRGELRPIEKSKSSEYGNYLFKVN